MRRSRLDVPSSYFHDLANWATINRVYAPKIRREVDEVRRDSARPELIERLVSVLMHERGHTLAMEVERAKIELSGICEAEIPLSWLEPGLSIRIDRSSLSAATSGLADRLGKAAGGLYPGGRARARLDQRGVPDGAGPPVSSTPGQPSSRPPRRLGSWKATRSARSASASRSKPARRYGS